VGHRGHGKSSGLCLFLWKGNENNHLGTVFVHHRMVSAVKRTEFNEIYFKAFHPAQHTYISKVSSFCSFYGPSLDLCTSTHKRNYIIIYTYM
jgi:hypothetical protein